MKALFEKTKYTKYYITSSGKIISKTNYHREKEIERKTQLNKSRGYVYFRTRVKNYQVHRLIASAFISNPDNKSCINQKDGNKQNNNVKNLEWVTHKENTSHAIKHGMIKLFKKNESSNLKYTNKQCEDVLKRIKSGMTYLKAGEKHNMPYSTVAHLARGSRREI